MAEQARPAGWKEREWIRPIIEQWVEQPNFRKEMRSDPRKALKDAGIKLTATQLKIVMMAAWNTPDPPATDVALLDRLYEFWMFGGQPVYW